MRATVRKAMVGGALLSSLPIRMAGAAAVSWFSRLQETGARNAASALSSRKREAEVFELRIAQLSTRAS